MNLKGVHLLLTYRCDVECDHCFVWGSPNAKGTFTFKQISKILEEARKISSVSYISIEGGEPFLYYPIMVKTVKRGVELGFHVEVLSNCYWATCVEDAVEWLLPIAESKDVELSLSSDPYHGEGWITGEVKNAVNAAKALNMKVGIMVIKCPYAEAPCPTEVDGVKVGLYELMYRGRACSKLAGKADKRCWREFTKCPYEDFVNQERVHIDPFGYVHVCQGISIGNAWQKPLSKIVEEYDPYANPILEPLIRGGPVRLLKSTTCPMTSFMRMRAIYATLRGKCYGDTLPDVLAPDQMYGEGLNG
ncbi:MAG: radical SAM protein [Candidatus Bathyarchaeia archaeon]